MTESFSFKDVPIGNYKVVAEPNTLTGEIRLITQIAGRIREEFIQTRDQQLRNALIDLGWRPPPEE